MECSMLVKDDVKTEDLRDVVYGCAKWDKPSKICIEKKSADTWPEDTWKVTCNKPNS